MTTSSVYTFGAAATNSGVGSVDWNNASNALTDNSSYADSTPGTGNQSYYLWLTNPNPTEIGDSDTIDAIRVRIRRDASVNNRISWNTIRLVVAGSVSGDDNVISGNWSTASTTDTAGDLVSDAWGLSLTGSDVKASNFGIAVAINGAGSAQGRVEFADITFEYTAVASGPTYTLTADAGSYTLSGQTANLLASRLLTANAGSYSVTGQDASLIVSRLLSAEQGNYTLTGNDASLIINRLLTAEAGSYMLSGQDASMIVTGKQSNLHLARSRSS